MINISELIPDTNLASATFTVTRTAGSFVNSRWTTGSPTTLTLVGSIQPLSNTEVMQLAEGDRISGSIAIWSSVELYTTRPDGISDEVNWDGKAWKIIKTNNYGAFGYYKSVAIRKQAF